MAGEPTSNKPGALIASGEVFINGVLTPAELCRPLVSGVDWWVLKGPDISRYVDDAIMFRDSSERCIRLRVLRAWPLADWAFVREEAVPFPPFDAER
jgi:hypothetical protein